MIDGHQKKVLLLRVGVLSLTVLILFFWIANLKNVWRLNSETIVQSDALEWEEFKEQLEQTTEEMERRLGESSSVEEEAAEPIISDDIPKIPSVAPTTTPLEIPSNCPAYINCMPTIGEARPCVIPPGCEEITQIAY